MNFSISDSEKDTLLTSLRSANLYFQQRYPGDRPDRQPVHTVYGGANLFKADTCIRMGEIALKSLQNYAPDFVTLAKVLEIDGHECLTDSAKGTKKLEKKLDKMSEKE